MTARGSRGVDGGTALAILAGLAAAVLVATCVALFEPVAESRSAGAACACACPGVSP